MPHSSTERQKEYRKKYREENKERLAAQRKKNREENKERELERKRTWRAANAEKVLEDSKNYREKNKERLSKQRRDWQQNNIENWLKVLYCSCKKRHHYKKDFVCDITLEDIISKYTEQNGLCAVTNIKMDHQIGSLNSVSIDRIDNTIGYTKENIHLVTKWINLGRGTASLDEIKTAFHNAVCAAN